MLHRTQKRCSIYVQVTIPKMDKFFRNCVKGLPVKVAPFPVRKKVILGIVHRKKAY